MVYWTIQHRSVVDSLEGNSDYYPDFSRSPQVHRKTYDKLIKVYNEVNNTAFKGLVFCLAKDPSIGTSLIFHDERELLKYLKERHSVLGALNNGSYSLVDEDHFLCKIVTDEFDGLRSCYVDFWNFIWMMQEEYEVGWNSFELIRSNHKELLDISYDDFINLSWQMMGKGKMVKPLMNNTILQLHIPFLKRSMLQAVYSLEGLL